MFVRVSSPLVGLSPFAAQTLPLARIVDLLVPLWCLPCSSGASVARDILLLSCDFGFRH